MGWLPGDNGRSFVVINYRTALIFGSQRFLDIEYFSNFTSYTV